jgi:hypothetical protein
MLRQQRYKIVKLSAQDSEARRTRAMEEDTEVIEVPVFILCYNKVYYSHENTSVLKTVLNHSITLQFFLSKKTYAIIEYFFQQDENYSRQ